MADAEPFEFDVFISYSSQDKVWVRGELLTRIEEAGVKACIDFRDFTRGAPSIKECERGVVKCRKTLLILTPDYIASGWGRIENIMVQTLDPANDSLRLIPLLKAECQKPLSIGALTHIDFTDGADHDLAWRQLFTALGKLPELKPPREPQRDEWFLAHPYPMPPNFTGRNSERQMLSEWLTAGTVQPLFVLRALGGFGKSALVWHWLTHDLPRADWPHVIWWSFYETDASFDGFLGATLNHLSNGEIKPSTLPARERLAELLRLLHPGTLLVLDGFERELRAFGGIDAAYQGDDVLRHEAAIRECVSPLAGLFLRSLVSLPGIHAKVLITTRLRPHEIEGHGGVMLQGCKERELSALHPSDAVVFFQSQGIRGTHTEIRAACAAYGYHPLSLRILAGIIIQDLQQPRDIAVVKRLDVSGDLIQRQHHVLEAAFEGLTQEQQALLGRIACFRGPVNYNVLMALSEAASATLDADLRDLIAVGLLHHDTREGRFDLHPIVRRYAYDRLAAPDRAATHTRLRDYFAAAPKPDKVTRLEDLAPVIELYHHTVRSGQLDEACDLFYDRLATPLYYQLGAYQLIIDLLRPLFPDGEDRPPRLKNESDQAGTLTALANCYSLSGQPRRAVPLFEQHNAIYEKQGNKSELAFGLGNLAFMAQLPIGALRAAEANLRRSIALYREFKDEFNEAVGHQELGRLLSYRAADAESETELDAAIGIEAWRKSPQGHGVNHAYRTLCDLLRLRSVVVARNWKHRGTESTEKTAVGSTELLRDLCASLFRKDQSPLDFARRALELADETARTSHPYERDYVRAHWLLGAAYLVAGPPDEAERHLHEALERCRRINAVDAEADILIDLARLRADTGAADEARRLAEEALLIADRSGYVLQGADAHLELARLALACGDKPTARHHAEEAHRLATCDGLPDHTYAAAYAESAALLAQL